MEAKIGRDPISRRAMLSALLGAVPVHGALDYYRCIFKSMAVNRSITHLKRPNGYMRGHATVRSGGSLFYVDSYTGFVSSIFAKAYEPYTYRAIAAASGSVFIDIGAYTGVYSLLAARRFKNVVAFEPNPRTADILQTNIDLNGTGNIDLRRVAIGEKDGHTVLHEGIFSSTYTTNGNSLLAKPEGLQIDVEEAKLDSLMSGYESVELIKVDVEGAEVAVLKGMQNLLPRVRTLILEVDAANTEAVSELLRGFDAKVLEAGELSSNVMFTNFTSR